MAMSSERSARKRFKTSTYTDTARSTVSPVLISPARAIRFRSKMRNPVKSRAAAAETAVCVPPPAQAVPQVRVQHLSENAPPQQAEGVEEDRVSGVRSLTKPRTIR